MRAIRFAFTGAFVAVLCAATAASAQNQPPIGRHVMTDTVLDRRLNPACTAAIPPASLTPVSVYVGIDMPTDTAGLRVRSALQPFVEKAASHVRAAYGAEGKALGRGEPRVTWKGAAGALRVTVFRDGPMAWTDPGGDTTLTAGIRALAAGLRTARDSGARIPWPAPVTQDSVVLTLSLYTLAVGRAPVEMPMLDRLDPLFQVMQPPIERALLRSGDGPRYPRRAKYAGILAGLEFMFDVDSTGRVDMATVTDVSPGLRPAPASEDDKHYRDFAKSIEDYLKRARITPARIGNCPVRDRVVQRFEFRINR